MSEFITTQSTIESVLPRTPSKTLGALKRLGITTISDLFYHLPTRYVTISGTKPIKEVSEGDRLVLFGIASNLKATKGYRSKRTMATGRLEDATGYIDLVWFNQPYIAKLIPEGAPIKVEGKVAIRRGKPYLSNPEFEVLKTLPEINSGTLFSNDETSEIDDQFITVVYPESRGVSSKWFSHSIQKLIARDLHHNLPDPIPEQVLQQLNLPDIATTMVWLHAPKHSQDAEVARKRLAFQEIFALQVINAQEEFELSHTPTFTIDPIDLGPVHESLGFTLTDAQQNSVDEIIADLETDRPMNRLLEGDVGSGKTAVAACALYSVVKSTAGKDFEVLQAAIMAPTEILARQHFEGLQKLLGHTDVTIGLLVGSGGELFPSKLNKQKATPISKNQLKRYVERGDIDILVGTHALIQKTVQFKRLALVVIDEQHRFGVRQRKNLARNKDGRTPHLLSMTATPIPRTLALTIYGNLDLSIIDTMPPGRKPVETTLLVGPDRKAVYKRIRTELENGRQAYVICARKTAADPDKTDTLELASVEETAEHLRKIFSEYDIGELHGSMSAKHKEAVMESFLANEFQILVATTVVEVGVNVPNASIILIEDAERYGLSQLHQLRGRVLRSTHQPYCYIATSSNSETSIERLQLFTRSSNGFELAEADLARRGPGALIGKRQSGLSDTAMLALQNKKLIQVAQKTAKEIVAKDPTLRNYPDLESFTADVKLLLHLE